MATEAAARTLETWRLESLPLSRISESTTNPRKNFDKKGLQELAESIRAQGVLQPVLVRPKGDRYELVVGARRLRAAKLVGLTEISAVVNDYLTDAEALEIQIIENLQRQDLGALEEALGYKALLESKPAAGDPKHAVESIAARVGKSISYVYQRLKLAELVPAMQKLLEEGWLTPGHAIDVARLQPADQEKAAHFCTHGSSFADGYGDENHKRDQAPSVRELRRWIQENCHLNLDKAPFDITDAKLLPKAGACTTCPKMASNSPSLFEGSGAGKKTCTDPGCYQEKKLALVKVSVGAVEEKQGIKPTLISAEYSPPTKQRQKGVLYGDKYDTATYDGRGGDRAIKKDSCPAARLGLYVDGEKVGKTAWICTDKKCKVHHPAYDVRSQTSGAAVSTLRKNQVLTKKWRPAVFAAVAAAMKKPTRSDLELVAVEFFKKLGHYNETPMKAALGWDEKVGKWGHPGLLTKKVASWPDAELLKHLVLFACAQDLVSGSWDSRGMFKLEVLGAVARRHKVNAAKLLRTLKAEQKKPKAKPQAPAAAKKRKKKAAK